MVIPLFKVFMSEEAKQNVQEVLSSGYIAQGPKVAEFEREVQKFLGGNHPVVAVNSGTSALQLALHLAGVRPATWVISTPMTCAATNTAILASGANIIWADIMWDGLIDPESVRRKLEQCWNYGFDVTAIMAVDWGGLPCDYQALQQVVSETAQQRIPIIEDAAQAFGATHASTHLQLADSGADYVCYSFGAIKHLTTGDGGALICPRDQVHRARKLRWHGLDRDSGADFRFEQNISESGFRYQMNDIAAAIGLGNIKHTAANLKAHQANSVRLTEYLCEADNVSIFPSLWPKHYNSACWIFTILVDDPDEFIRYMAKHGVGASRVHKRNDAHSCFPSTRPGKLPGLDFFAAHEVAIPCGWWLTDADVEQIANAVKDYPGKAPC